MAVCQTCGNDYLMAFEVRTVSDDVYVFDSFECAIQSLAPICENCQVRIVGARHGGRRALLLLGPLLPQRRRRTGRDGPRHGGRPAPLSSAAAAVTRRRLTSTLLELYGDRPSPTREFTHAHEGVHPGGARRSAHRLLERRCVSCRGRTHPGGPGRGADLTQPHWWILNHVAGAPGNVEPRRPHSSAWPAFVRPRHRTSTRSSNDLVTRGWLEERAGTLNAHRSRRGRASPREGTERQDARSRRTRASISTDEYVAALNVLRRMIANLGGNSDLP